jgi:hypothetical protein
MEFTFNFEKALGCLSQKWGVTQALTPDEIKSINSIYLKQWKEEPSPPDDPWSSPSDNLWVRAININTSDLGFCFHYVFGTWVIQKFGRNAHRIIVGAIHIKKWFEEGYSECISPNATFPILQKNIVTFMVNGMVGAEFTF